VIPDTPVGLRDRAIVLTLTLTGRRRAEVLNMTVSDLSAEDGKVWCRYRGKGGKTGKRELPQPAYGAIVAALAAFGHDMATLPPGAPLWPARGRNGAALTSGTFYANLQRYFHDAGVARCGRAHLPPFGRRAAEGRRREHRGRESLPRSELVGRDDDLPAPAGGAGGPLVGEGGCSDRHFPRARAIVRDPAKLPLPMPRSRNRFRAPSMSAPIVCAEAKAAHSAASTRKCGLTRSESRGRNPRMKLASLVSRSRLEIKAAAQSPDVAPSSDRAPVIPFGVIRYHVA